MGVGLKTDMRLKPERCDAFFIRSYLYTACDYLSRLKIAMHVYQRGCIMSDLVEFGSSGAPLLPAMNKMSVGQYLQSPSGQYQLLLQEDSNFVLRDGGAVIWVANDGQRYSRYYKAKHYDRPAVVMREYLEVHQPALKRYWCAVGYSAHGNNHPAGQRRVFAVLQDDGNLVLVDKIPL